MNEPRKVKALLKTVVDRMTNTQENKFYKGGYKAIKEFDVLMGLFLQSGYVVKSEVDGLKLALVAPHLLCKPLLRWLRGTGAKPAFASLAAN